MDTYKVCTECLVRKPLNEFYYNRIHERHHSHCKQCVSERSSSRFKQMSPEQKREYYDKRNRRRNEKRKLFGRHDQDYDRELLRSDLSIFQNNKCAICGEEFTDTNVPNLDHCHKTNVARGLLCSNCNVGLGHFRDNIESLHMAIEYIKNPPTKSMK